MAFDTVTSTTYYHYTEGIIKFIGAIIVTIILFIELKTFYTISHGLKHQTSLKNQPSNSTQTADSNSRVKKTVRVRSRFTTHHRTELIHFLLRISSFICYDSTLIIGIITKFNVPCAVMRSMGFLYSIGKLFMYLVFIKRLKTIYNNSLFAYSTKGLLILSIVCILWSICNAFGVAVSISVYVDNINGHLFCMADSPTQMLVSVLLMDVSMSSICCYLFVRPLLGMLRFRKEHCTADTDQDEEDTNDLKAVIEKSTILTFVATGSTFCAFIVAATTGFLTLFALDIVTNTICIMLFNTEYNTCYDALCCGAIKLFESKICCCCKEIQSDDPISETATVNV